MIYFILLAQESVIQSAANPTIVEIIQALVLPVVLVSIPYLFQKTRKAAEKADEVAQSVSPDSSSEKPMLYGMVEKSLMTLGELRGDIKDLKEGQDEQNVEFRGLRREFESHMVDDQNFATEATSALNEVAGRLDHIEESLTSPLETRTP